MTKLEEERFVKRLSNSKYIVSLTLNGKDNQFKLHFSRNNKTIDLNSPETKDEDLRSINAIMNIGETILSGAWARRGLVEDEEIKDILIRKEEELKKTIPHINIK